MSVSLPVQRRTRPRKPALLRRRMAGRDQFIAVSVSTQDCGQPLFERRSLRTADVSRALTDSEIACSYTQFFPVDGAVGKRKLLPLIVYGEQNAFGVEDRDQRCGSVRIAPE